MFGKSECIDYASASFKQPLQQVSNIRKIHWFNQQKCSINIQLFCCAARGYSCLTSFNLTVFTQCDFQSIINVKSTSAFSVPEVQFSGLAYFICNQQDQSTTTWSQWHHSFCTSYLNLSDYTSSEVCSTAALQQGKVELGNKKGRWRRDFITTFCSVGSLALVWLVKHDVLFAPFILLSTDTMLSVQQPFLWPFEDKDIYSNILPQSNIYTGKHGEPTEKAIFTLLDSERNTPVLMHGKVKRLPFLLHYELIIYLCPYFI